MMGPTRPRWSTSVLEISFGLPGHFRVLPRWKAGERAIMYLHTVGLDSDEAIEKGEFIRTFRIGSYRGPL